MLKIIISCFIIILIFGFLKQEQWWERIFIGLCFGTIGYFLTGMFVY